MSTGLDDGHLAAAELLEAAEQLARDREAGTPDGEGRGAAELRAILQAECDDYQRALWFAVSQLPLDAAVEHLRWLTDLMGDRAGMFRAIQSSGAMMPLLPGSGGDWA